MKKPKHWLGTRCYVYIYYDVDGTPIYVGIGSWDGRWREHWRGDTHLGRLLRKRERELGISLYPEFIEADSWEDAQLGEVLYIGCFGRADLGLGPLFNGTDGGDGGKGRVVSNSELSKRIGRRHTEESKAKMGLTNIGKPRSEETKMKLSIAHTGKTLSAEHRNKLSSKCTIDGIVVYPSKRALTDALGHGKHGFRHPNFRYV